MARPAEAGKATESQAVEAMAMAKPVAAARMSETARARLEAVAAAFCPPSLSRMWRLDLLRRQDVCAASRRSSRCCSTRRRAARRD